MTEFEIQPPSKRCFASGNSLPPGTVLYSVLMEENGNLVRRDFGESSWQGLDSFKNEKVIAFWKSINPKGSDSGGSSSKKKKNPIDYEILYQCFRQLVVRKDNPEQNQFIYVLALELMRKKKLSFEDYLKQQETDFLSLKDVKTKEKYLIEDLKLSESEMESVQEKMTNLFGW